MHNNILLKKKNNIYDTYLDVSFIMMDRSNDAAETRTKVMGPSSRKRHKFGRKSVRKFFLFYFLLFFPPFHFLCFTAWHMNDLIGAQLV